jgi:hypothetical protein
MATFGAVTIYINAERDPGERHTTASSERHMPGGNVRYIDRGGVNSRRLVLPLLFPTYSHFAALLALLDEVALLTSDVANGLARLDSIQRDTVYNAGESTGSAEFVLL